MASNPYVNKVVNAETNATIIDLTADTALASDVAAGKYFHLATGERVQGTSTGGGGSVYQDANGYLVLSEDGGGSSPQGNIPITANGTYDVTSYAGATVNVPIGMTETDLNNYISRSSSFTDITWPSGLTTIGNGAFKFCQYFNPASLPSTVTSIGTEAFQNCIRLALTSLPSGVTNIGGSAFYGCESLALSSLPSGITGFNSYVFYHCKNITLTSLPSAVKTISSYAFNGCSSMTSISCDGAITTLGSSAFTGDSTHSMALTSASFPNLAIASNIGQVFGSTAAASACQSLAFCDIGNAAGIAANAFANCYSLTKLVLRKTSVAALAATSAFTNTPMDGYNGLTGTVYVPQSLISSYQTATNWKTLYDAGTVTFAAIEGSDYELD